MTDLPEILELEAQTKTLPKCQKTRSWHSSTNPRNKVSNQQHLFLSINNSYLVSWQRWTKTFLLHLAVSYYFSLWSSTFRTRCPHLHELFGVEQSFYDFVLRSRHKHSLECDPENWPIQGDYFMKCYYFFLHKLSLKFHSIGYSQVKWQYLKAMKYSWHFVEFF